MPDSDLEPAWPQPAQATRLPYSFAKRHGLVLQIESEDNWCLLARPDWKLSALAEARRLLGRPLYCRPVSEQQFNEALSRSYQGDAGDSMQAAEGIGDQIDLEKLADLVPETEDLMDQEDDAPIIRLINAILQEAVRENASDIHIETFERRLSVRLRVDGVLREVLQPRRELAPLLVSRIKVMARLDIAEKRVPQDGRISVKLAGREVDVRVSTMPSSAGERVVLRLLDKQAGRLNLSALGLTPRDHHELRELIAKPHGILLVTGPTGSGKTTSLYASLTELNDHSRNILTVEDPIEYQLDGIGQTQVNTKVDMTFARGLRAILRQDPDVVMVGEIRDRETAEIAVQASLTGHLVLSTLHTNSAVGAVTRLVDMGVEPFLLSSSLIGVVAQRLVRVLCPSCREAHPADHAECELLGADPAHPPLIYRATGCASCNHRGYKGRTGIYEVVSINDNLRRLIHERGLEQELESAARAQGPSIRSDGMTKVLAGITSLDEVLRVTRED
ncbi:type II secretion system ATPase GspE [Amnimonas aquatica]|uniref:type II secretion system ATPase GspE n=1 Tax=Amnimonas aquatica TaxID=2094561 RepID=UPI002404C55D|nr:type II secretion system ATPase GspE [Amnimonas aquatica]